MAHNTETFLFPFPPYQVRWLEFGSGRWRRGCLRALLMRREQSTLYWRRPGWHFLHRLRRGCLPKLPTSLAPNWCQNVWAWKEWEKGLVPKEITVTNRKEPQEANLKAEKLCQGLPTWITTHSDSQFPSHWDQASALTPFPYSSKWEVTQTLILGKTSRYELCTSIAYNARQKMTGKKPLAHAVCTHLPPAPSASSPGNDTCLLCLQGEWVSDMKYLLKKDRAYLPYWAFPS
jgi:hypothetical protein